MSLRGIRPQGPLRGAAALPLLLGLAPFTSLHVPGADLELMPESERPFRRVVIGLDPIDLPYFMTPEIPARPGDPQAGRAETLRRQLYELRLELDHGDIFRCAPPETVFFVAVPDPARVPEASGAEAEIVRGFLRTRAGWSPREVADRVRFFTVPTPLPYPQDMAEAIGFDHEGRLVLAVGSDTDPFYLAGVRSLVQTYPGEFAVRELGGSGAPAVNTEGGDLSIIWLPEGQVGVLIGRHRVVRFLEHRFDREFEGEAIDQEKIEEARRAFRADFFGREIVIAGEAALRNPGWVNDDVFHADMVVVVLRSGGRVVAFVPTFDGQAIDAVTGEPIGAERQRLVQREYDLVARQMQDRGFAVVRLPFADHPARSPVNVSRFYDADARRHVVLLARYPSHLSPGPGRPTPQAQLRDSFTALAGAAEKWNARPSEARWTAVEARIEAAWATLRAVAALPNPFFDRQAARYEANGIRVLPVPMYPTGEGSLHCLILR